MSTPLSVVSYQLPQVMAVPFTWLHISNPQAEEIRHLQEELHIPPSFITHCLDINERAHVEHINEDTLIILRIPHAQGKMVHIPYIIVPLGIIVSGEYLITICPVETDIFRQMAVEPQTITTRNAFILHLLIAATAIYLMDLQTVNQWVDEAEDRLRGSTRNREVLELLAYQKCLAHFAVALKSNELMMERLSKSHWFSLTPEGCDLFADALTEHEQIVEMVSIAENILSQMMDAFASIISNNLNVVMEFLASITVILALPSLIASLYGMNVALPWQNTPFAFWMVLMFSTVLVLPVTIIFLKRHWL